MKRTIRVTAIFILAALTSCDHEIIDFSRESRVSIKPAVSSVTETKADSAADADSLIATYVLSEDPGNPLYLQVFERDLNGFMSGAVTKGQVTTTYSLNNNIKSFRMQAYADSAWHDNTIPAGSAGSESNPNAKGLYFGGSNGLAVNKSSADWNMESEQIWLNDVPISFWSWNGVQPVVGWNSTSERYDIASISDFTVNSTVTSQIDPILAYNGEKRIFDDEGEITGQTSTNSSYSRTDNEVDIEFKHALAAVIFDISGVDATYSVSNIKLSNIYPSGDCSISVDNDGTLNFDWTAKGTPQAFSQDFEATDFNVSGRQPLESSSKVFFMIPQVISSDAIMTVSFNGFESFDKIIQPGSVEWKAGKYYTYKLTKTLFTDYTFTFDDGSLETSKRYSSKGSDLTGNYIDVISEKSRTGSTDTKAEWRIKSYQIDGESSVTVEGMSFEADGLKVKLDKDNSRLDVTVNKRVMKTRGDHEYWANTTGRTDDLGWSPEDWSTTTATTSDPVDLSKYNFQSDAVTTTRNTANCYIVRHAGSYKIPLIYGNAITGNSENTQAYKPTIASGGTNGLTPFKNYNDLDIKSAYIENSYKSGSSLASNRSNAVNITSAEIVWQDHSGVISLSDSPIVGSTISSGTYGASNVRFLQFTVNNSTVCQCNAVIAVKDAGGSIVWSWHIWVTNDPALSGGAVTVSSNSSVNYGFLPVGCLGWIEPAKYDERPDIEIVLEQLSDEDDIIVTIKQPEKREYGYGTYYQFGRKDPMPKNTSLAGYDGTGVRPASLGEAISHPGTYYQQSTEESRQWCTDLYFNLWTGQYSKAGEYTDQTTSMIKTIYDPCPPGYKVPAPKAFSGFTTTNGAAASDMAQWNVKDADVGQYAGLYFYTALGAGGTVNTGGSTVFVPVCGYIDRSKGTFGSNSSAFYWSSASSSASSNKQGQSYKFSSREITTNNSNSAIEAFSIRPVQE